MFLLIKWFVMGTVIYFLYKQFFALPPAKDSNSHPQDRNPPNDSDDAGEFIDYEEVD